MPAEAETSWYTQEQVDIIRRESFKQGEIHAPKRDTYLSSISDESLSVLEKFGAEAPKLLNDYACEIEDALIDLTTKLSKTETELKAARTLLDLFKDTEDPKEEPQPRRMAGKLKGGKL